MPACPMDDPAQQDCAIPPLLCHMLAYNVLVDLLTFLLCLIDIFSSFIWFANQTRHVYTETQNLEQKIGSATVS